MKKTLALFLIICSMASVYTQVTPLPQQQQQQQQQQRQGAQGTMGDPGNIDVQFEGEKPPITDYQIISYEGKVTHVDTTLTIAKDYQFNYLRRDDYALMPFANVGQTYNTLAHDFSNVRLKPLFGARARHFNYMENEDINYYHVPTPLTELYYKTAFEQGHQLDAFFTINPSERFNFSIAYKGLRSLGNYQNALTSTGNFRFTTSYRTKNNKYNLRAHIVFQDLLNQENGGLKEDFIPFFVNDTEFFRDRARLEVNFEDAENILEGKRFYLEHDYSLINQKDTLTYTSLKVGNILSFEDKFYQYTQGRAFEGFGPSYASQNLFDIVTLEEFNAGAFASLENNLLGKIKVFTEFTDFNYGYNSVLILEEQRITNRFKGQLFEVGAQYQKEYRGFELFGKAAINAIGDFEGNYFLGTASYRLDEDNMARATMHINTVAPNYNFMLYQSDYINYNWQTQFRNVKTQFLQFELLSKRLLNASVSYTGIDDYTYFTRDIETGTTAPAQHGGRINYLNVEGQREFHFGKFSFNNRLTYQQVVGGEQVFNVPKLLGRNSIYFSEHLFRRALFLQTGFTAKYFTEYNMDAYDPVLAEFYVQNEQKIGNFPMVDFFLNAKISQTRIYFKLEHINSFITKNNYFSAPGYPYRDWTIRFGLVWNFFM